MATVFPSKDNFLGSLSEVQLILRRARRSRSITTEYNICIKSALLFLVAKFEAFLEDAISEYVQFVENAGLCPSELPDVLKLHCADNLIDEKFISDLRHHRPSALPTIERVSKLCVGEESVTFLDLDKAFDYGRHGQKAIVRLFSRIGVTDVFESCPIFEYVQTITGRVRVPIDIQGDINALTNYRNTILHDDVTPSVTHQQIRDYQKHLVQFANRLVRVLDDRVSHIVR
jgi:hypothetical protein